MSCGKQPLLPHRNHQGGSLMSLFRLDASIRAEGSHSRAIADIVEQEWRAGRPDELVTRRLIGLEPVPATAWADAVSARGVPAKELTPRQQIGRASCRGRV